MKPTNVRWWIFGLCGFISWLLYLHRYAWGIVKPSYRAEHPELTNAEMGTIDSALMVTYAIAQIPLGVLGDRFGPRLILTVLILGWSGALVLLSQMEAPVWIAVQLALLGLFQAGAYPLISKVTRNWFPLRYRTTVQGVVTAMGRVGGACASLIIATLLLGLMHMEWRNALVALAVPGLFAALLVWLMLRDTPAQHPGVNEAERELLTDPTARATASTDPPPAFDWSPTNVFNFGAILTYAFLSTFADQLYVFWIATFLKDAYQMSNEAMGIFAPLPLLGGAVGGIVGGILNDFLQRKLGNRRLARSLTASVGKGLAAAFIAASVFAADGRVAMVFLLFTKLFGDWSLPTQWGTITDIGGRRAATVFAIVNSIAAVGGAIASPIMGKVKDLTGWNGLFFFVAGMYFVCSITWWFIDCTKPLVKESE